MCSKLVYRRGDEVVIKIDGVLYSSIIWDSKVDLPDDVTGESVIHYTSRLGFEFTDDKIT